MQTHLFLLHLLLLLSIAATVTTGNRRILHQPFFPQDSSPPTQPPPNPPTDQLPFFPNYPSPPPPPTTATASSVPANISSLSLPKPPSPKPISKKLIFAAIAAVIAAVCVIAVVILLHIRKRKNQNFPNTHQKPETPSSLSSPVRSVSLSISPPASLSPKVFSRTKSPELVPLHLTDSSQASSPRPSSDSSVDRINNSVPPQPALGFTAASSPASSSPERYSMKNQSSSPISSDVSSDQILHSPVRADNFMGAPPPQPPPPPPLPPARHWESRKTPSNKVVQAVLRPPVLVAPSRPVSLGAPPLISPIEMPQISENLIQPKIV